MRGKEEREGGRERALPITAPEFCGNSSMANAKHPGRDDGTNNPIRKEQLTPSQK